MMKRIAPPLALLFAGTVATAETCPPGIDVSEPIDRLIAEIRVAPNEAAARPISNRMWELWTTAPDIRAQEMLDRGAQHLRVADYLAASAAFTELVDYCPDYAEGFNQRAFAAFLSGDYAEALEDLDRALDRSPTHIGALSGKALSLFGLGRMEAGQAVLREALNLNPWLAERAYLIDPPGQEL